MAQSTKRVYRYLGPVRVYDYIASNKWGSTTHAVSERQARNNLAHQFRRYMGLGPSVPVKLTGELTSYTSPAIPRFTTRHSFATVRHGIEGSES